MTLSTNFLVLTAASDNLPIHEDKSRGVYVKGLLEVFVGSVVEVYQVMQQGIASRVVASTGMSRLYANK